MDAETLLRDIEQATESLNQDKVRMIQRTILDLCPDISQDILDTVTPHTKVVFPSRLIPPERQFKELPDWLQPTPYLTDSICLSVINPNDYRNPHTNEVVQTRGGNQKTLKEWKEEYGKDEVESWVEATE